MHPGVRVELTQDITSMNNTPQKILKMTRGVIRAIDDTDGSMELEFASFQETQWVSAEDICHMRPDEEVQISPTENFLSHDYRGWTFVESKPLCCGQMPRYVENFLIRLIHQHSCWKERDTQFKSDSEARGVGISLSTSNTSDTEGSLGKEGAQVARQSTAANQLKNLQEQIRLLQSRVAAIQSGNTGESVEAETITLIPGKTIRAGHKASFFDTPGENFPALPAEN